jgi:hypothetical protein
MRIIESNEASWKYNTTIQMSNWFRQIKEKIYKTSLYFVLAAQMPFLSISTFIVGWGIHPFRDEWVESGLRGIISKLIEFNSKEF